MSRKLLLEIVVYVLLIIAVTYALKQFEGVDAGRMKPGVPSFLDFLK